MDSINKRKMAFLTGERVYLRPMEKGDLDHMKSWYNDPDVRGLIGIESPTSTVSSEEWFNKVNEDTNRIWFTVALKENDKEIGEAGFLRMYHTWRQTDMTMIIGDKSEWGKGYGTETVALLMDYAFGYLNFHRISIGVVGFNARALEFWQKVGFKIEGVQRDGYYFNHKYHEFIMMSILEEEYRELYRK